MNALHFAQVQACLEEMRVGQFPAVEPAEKFTRLTADSRECEAHSIFVAVHGTGVDGHQYVKSVLTAHPTALAIGEQPLPGEARYLRVRDSREALSRLASTFAGDPSRKLKVVGVTGTSGKTTTTYLIESMLKAAGAKVAVFGTVNFRIGDTVLPSTHTTPGAVELHVLIAEAVAKGCTHLVMEVSSHALKQRRVSAVAFDVGVFTNLSREHLDFHPDMADYFAAKRILFTELAAVSRAQGKGFTAVLNRDDEHGRKLLAEVPGAREFACLEGLTMTTAGLRGRSGATEFHSKLFGKFNAENLAGAIEAARALGLSDAEIQMGIDALPSVPGRLERVEVPGNLEAAKRTVLVDYAHKPDALEKVLHTLREAKDPRGALVVIFGCGGDRDRTKRPVMGEMAARLGDRVFLTSDNPRTEDPQAIITEVLTGIDQAKHGAKLTVEADRRAAIGAAIASSKPHDLIVIAGKGHEDYQILGKTKVHFDDREEARAALGKL